MCEVCQHIEALSQVQVNQYDPTRTTTLRNAMVRDSNRRFDELARTVKKAVDDEDCFGLKQPEVLQSTPGKGAFAFGSSQRKVEEFLRWLDRQVERGLLTITEIDQFGESVNSIWTNKYITDSYKRGLMSARTKMKNAGYAVPSVEATGGIMLAMTPIHIERAGLLYSRVYNELKGITTQMEQIIGRVLAQGMIDGDNPRLIARKLVAAINGTGAGDLGLYDQLGRFIPAKRRAEIMARTEIIRAHHLSTIQEYRNFGVAGVSVIAEFKTANDDKVCAECASLEGRRFTLDEVEGLIPVHPMCFIDPQVPIYTSKGWKPIGKVKIGDLVLTHKERFRKVYALPRTPKQRPEVVKITFVTGKTFTVTSNHSIRIKKGGSSRWIEAGKIKEGDKLAYLGSTCARCGKHTKNYHTLGVEVRNVEKWNLQRARTLYNLSVEEDESYIAKGVVVHNCRCTTIPILKKGGK